MLITFSSIRKFVKTVKFMSWLILKHEQVTGAVTLVWIYTRYEFFIIIVIFYRCTAFLKQVFGMKTVTLEVIQPSTGPWPVCPGQEVIITCTVATPSAVQEMTLNWNLQESVAGNVVYDINNPQSGPQTLGDFITTAVFMITTDSTVIISNATLKSARLSNHNNMIVCDSPPQDNDLTATITIAGTHK